MASPILPGRGLSPTIIIIVSSLLKGSVDLGEPGGLKCGDPGISPSDVDEHADHPMTQFVGMVF